MALTDNLISFWELEEASGTRADAVTASANNLTDVNTVTQNPGIVGNAAQFTRANSERLTCASNSGLAIASGQSFTINCWAYVDTPANSMTMLGKWNGVANQSEYIVDKAAGGVFRFVHANAAGSSTGIVSSGTTPSAATWYMITAWQDDGANSMNIAINAGSTSTASVTGTFAGTATFELGAQNATTFMDGRLDQVGFWKRVLTAAERTQLYNSGNGMSYADMVGAVAPVSRYGMVPVIASLGMISSGGTATQLTTAIGLFPAVVGFQWVSGSVTIGTSGVTAAGANAYFTLDTNTRVKELRTDESCDSLPIKDMYCIGSGSFICWYQIH